MLPPLSMLPKAIREVRAGLTTWLTVLLVEPA
jgi:hypothetical protein